MAKVVIDYDKMREDGLLPPEPADAPADSPAVEVNVEGDPGLLEQAADVVNGAAGGVRNAIQETVDFGVGVYDAVDNHTFDAAAHAIDPNIDPEADDGTPEWLTLPEAEVNTTAGQITRDVAQFVTGFVGAGKFLKGAKLFQGGGKALQYGRATLQGAMADGIAMDPQQERLSNLIEEYPSLQTPITDYLAADPEDSDAEGRLKNALEGIVLGAATDGFVSVLKTMKRGMKPVAENVSKEAQEQIIREGVEETDRAISNVSEIETIERETGIAVDGDVKARAAAAEEINERPSVDVEGFKNHLLKVGRGEADLGEFDNSLFNIEKWDSPDEVKVVEQALENEIAPEIIERAGGVQSLEKIGTDAAKDVAEMVGSDTDTLMHTLGQTADGMEGLARKMVSGKLMLQSYNKEIAETVKRINLKPTEADQLRLVKLVDQATGYMDSLKRMQTEAARATSAGRIMTWDAVKTADIDLINETLEKVGGKKRVQRFARMMEAANGDPKAMSKLMRKGWKGKLFDISMEYYINALLSGVKTHVVNLTNTVKAFSMPVEKMVGSVGRGGFDKEMFMEGQKQLVSMHKFLGDAWQMAGKALKMEENILDPMHKVQDAPMYSLSPQNLGIEGQSFFRPGVGMSEADPMASFVDGLGQLTRIPSRLLMASDEFFKQVSYRSHLYSQLYTQGVKQKLEGEALQEFIDSKFAKFFDESGAGLAKDSLQWSRESTFTQDLEYGFGKGLQTFANTVPLLRLIFPFIRTPTNILRNVVDHTPGAARMTKRWSGAMAEGGERAALAKGAERVGGMLWATGFMMAANGQITGGGPKDWKMRQNLLRSGWQPYSFKVGDKYVSFSRADPWGSFFGLAADLYEINQDMSDTELGEVAKMGMMALQRNITSKTYLRGLTDLINALNDPERYGERFVHNFVSSWVPFSSGMTMFRNAEDPNMREVWDVVDAIKNRLPGYSEELPAKRDWLTGEPITYGGAFSRTVNPFTVWQDKNDPVMDELVRLGHGFSAPPKYIQQGGGKVELDSTLYSEFCKLHGTTRIGRYTLRERLERVMKSKAYDINREKYADTGDEYTSRRVMMIQKWITAYRKKAKHELLDRNPELAAKLRQARSEAIAAKRGKPVDNLINFGQ
ncbi:hypothetical protein [Desulfovibrio oxyclinae]|uniref:hypothetical protein n=1 Tax=Desulfovibrio oxyclinae TaxID=63560 RepID=UPI00037878AD|nr:hypothetical protein [Desulfovibrio oxyclinae]